VSQIWSIVAAIGAAVLYGVVDWLRQADARSAGAQLQAAKTAEQVNVDVAKAIAAERTADARPVDSLRARDPDSRT